MSKDHAILSMVVVASVSTAIWQGSIFAGTAVFGALSVFVFHGGWK